MKTIILSVLLITLTITGCQKQQAEDPKENSTATAQFEKSDAIIGTYLDKLDSPETPQDEKTKILCVDYPAEYKTNYMPALLKLQPNEYTEVKLLADLKSALDYYKKKFVIKC